MVQINADGWSWTPHRKGDVYCSPACGMGCTRKAFDAAMTDADALVSRLGEDWTPRVWENLGWHYSAISSCGRWKVHPVIHEGRIISYTAFLGPAGSGGGTWAEHGDTPELAIEATRKAMREAVGYLLDLLTND